MDAGRAEGCAWRGRRLLSVPEAAEEREYRRETIGVVVMAVGEDDVRDTWGSGIMLPCGVEEGLL